MKGKVFILIVCILILVLFIGYELYLINDNIFHNKIISEKEATSLIEERELYTKQISILFNENEMPLIKDDEGGDYYLLSQNQDNSYLGRITVDDDFEISVIDPRVSKSELMKKNIPIKIIIYDDENYLIVNIKLTNLPVMSIRSGAVEDDNTFGKLTFLDSQGTNNSKNYATNNHYIRYHVRGASSYNSPKKSYKLNFMDKDREKEDVSFLGMREDNDWILNPIYFDYSNMREKIGFDLWNLLSSNYQHTMEYVELVIDNEYQGIYYLQEPVDQKTFSASREEVRVSIKTHIYGEPYNDTKTNLSEEVNKFKYDSDYLDLAFIDELVKSFVATFMKTDEPSNEDFKFDYDLENSVDYTLLINLILAVDNEYKNEKVLFKSQGDKTYTVLKSPWDLDWSLNNENTLPTNDITLILEDLALDQNFKSDEEFIGLIKNKYKAIRRTFYNSEYLNLLVDKYKNYLLEGGALFRDNMRWSEFYSITDTAYGDDIFDLEDVVTGKAFELSTNNIKKFFVERIEVLDEHFGGL